MRRARPLGQVTNVCPPEPNCPLLPCYEECAHSEYVLSLVEPKLLNSQALLKDLATSVLKVQEQWLQCVCEDVPDICTQGAQLGFSCVQCNAILETVYSFCDREEIECDGETYWFRDPCVSFRGNPCILECKKGYFDFTSSAEALALYTAIVEALQLLNLEFANLEAVEAMVQAIWGEDAFVIVKDCVFYIYPGENPSELLISLSCIFESILPLPFCSEFRFIGGDCCTEENIIVEQAFSVCDGGWVNCGGIDYWWKDPCFGIEGNSCLTECRKGCFNFQSTPAWSDFHATLMAAIVNVGGVISDEVGWIAFIQEVWGPDAVGCVDGCRFYVFLGQDPTETEVALSCFFEDVMPLPECAEVRFLCLPCCPGQVVVEQAFSVCDGGWINCGGADYWWKDPCFSIDGDPCLTTCVTECFDPSISIEATELNAAVWDALDNVSTTIYSDAELTAVAQEIWGLDAFGCVDGCSYYIFPGRDATALEVSLSLFFAEVMPLPVCGVVRFLCLPCCPHGQIVVAPTFSFCESGMITCGGVDYWWRDGCVSIEGDPCLLECVKECFDPNMSVEAFDLHLAMLDAVADVIDAIDDDVGLTLLVQEIWGVDAVGCVDGCVFYIYPGREPSALEISLSCFFAEKLPLLDCAEVRFMGLGC